MTEASTKVIWPASSLSMPYSSSKEVNIFSVWPDLEARALRPSHRRLWRLCFAVDEAVLWPYLSRDQMRVVLGHLVDTLCLRRELLAVLCLAHTFIAKTALKWLDF